MPVTLELYVFFCCTGTTPVTRELYLFSRFGLLRLGVWWGGGGEGGGVVLSEAIENCMSVNG